jgi:hypothetical protein
MCNTESTNKKKPRCIKSVEKVISTNDPIKKKQRTRRDSGKYLRKNVNGCSIDKIVMAIRINGCVLRQHLRIYRNFCSVHEEITSIRLYTPCNSGLRSQGCVQPD